MKEISSCGKSRKGMILLTLAMLGVIIGFIAFLVISTEEATEREQRFIGENALAILRADQKAQLVLAYLDMAALFATREGIFLLAEQGGISADTPCGMYAGYSIWQAPVGEEGHIERCVPERIDGELSSLISRLIDEHAQGLLVSDQTTYETYQLPVNNYQIVLRQDGDLLDVVGNARNDLYFQVRRDRVVAYTPEITRERIETDIPASTTPRAEIDQEMGEGEPSRTPPAGQPPRPSSDIAGEDVIVGDYTIDPAFRVSVDYDINDYAALQETVFGGDSLITRIDACGRRGGTIGDCIRSSLERLNQESAALDRAQMTIVDGPCDPEENIRSDLVEGYLGCEASEDSACTCNIRLEQAPQNEQTPVRITLTKDLSAQSGKDTDLLIDVIATHAVRWLDGTAHFVEPEEIQIEVSVEGENITLYKEQDTLYYVLDESAPSMAACTMHKRTFKFCAKKEDAGDAVLWRLADGTPTLQSPQYKFALTFPDVASPSAADEHTLSGALTSESATVSSEPPPAIGG